MPFFHDGELLHSLAGTHIGIFSRVDLMQQGDYDYALAAYYEPRVYVLLYVGTQSDCDCAFGAFLGWLKLGLPVLYKHDLRNIIEST